jgi:peptidoglycan pentaglycine glycine transferase (the first glycine)
MVQVITPSPRDWDVFVQAQPRAHILQLSAWGELKTAYGWSAARIALSENGAIIAGAQLLFRPLPFRLGTMAYLPMGPYTPPEHERALWSAIDDCAKKHGAAFIKWEPGMYGTGETPPDMPSLGFRESAQTIQPPRTVLIDISADEDAILKRMNQGTRRKIRQSLKDDLLYYEAAGEDVKIFTGMMQTTGSRNEFGVHEPAYYQLAYDLFVRKGQSGLIVAEHERDPLGGVMVFGLGKTGWYFYGASSDVKRNLMGAYGVQWMAILWAKEHGCTSYDMWGIPDEDEAALESQFESRSDGLWGVYGFKRGWGGEVVRSLGAWDKPYNPLVYAAYRLALRVGKQEE